MKVVVVYKDESDHARSVYDFLHNYEMQTGRTLETIDPETQAGADFCRLYDIVEYPSVVAIANDGILQNIWRGTPLPLVNEVSYYDKGF